MLIPAPEQHRPEQRLPRPPGRDEPELRPASGMACTILTGVDIRDESMTSNTPTFAGHHIVQRVAQALAPQLWRGAHSRRHTNRLLVRKMCH